MTIYDHDDPDEDDEGHGYDCDCPACVEEHFDCGLLPDHLGGGCQDAGSEQCEFECPIRQRMRLNDDD